MQPDVTAIDLSDYDGAPRMRPERDNAPEPQIKNKNGVYIAVIAVSFVVTAILYAIVFKNLAPTKPNINPLPAVDNWQAPQKNP